MCKDDTSRTKCSDDSQLASWQLEFQEEEVEANLARVCYCCNQVGHQRHQCPETKYNRGYHRSLMKRCFNCGEVGHRYAKCTKALKSSLQRRLNERRNANNQNGYNGFQQQNQQVNVPPNYNQQYNQQGYNGSGYNQQYNQQGFNQTGAIQHVNQQGFNQPGGNQQVNQQAFNPRGATQQQIQQGYNQNGYIQQVNQPVYNQHATNQQAIQQGNGQYASRNQHIVTNNIQVDKNKWYSDRRRRAENCGMQMVKQQMQAMNIQQAFMVEYSEDLQEEVNQYMCNSATDASNDTIEVCKDNKWVKVSGCVDTGCFTTTGSIQNHAKLCVAVWDYIGHKRLFVRTAGGNRFEVLKQGLIQIRINGTEIKNMGIMLVDASNWTMLLVGRDAINYYGLSHNKKDN